VPFSPSASYEPPFPLTPVASARVGNALTAAVRTHDAAMRELQAAIAVCVAELHVLGMRPEVALVTMEAFVRHTATTHPPPGHAPSRGAADALLDDVAHWCIDSYFRPDPGPSAPPASPATAPPATDSVEERGSLG
jgi:hypothetical protein